MTGAVAVAVNPTHTTSGTRSSVTTITQTRTSGSNLGTASGEPTGLSSPQQDPNTNSDGSPPQHKTDIGAIVGGVIGGLTALGLLSFLFYTCYAHRRTSRPQLRIPIFPRGDVNTNPITDLTSARSSRSLIIPASDAYRESIDLSLPTYSALPPPGPLKLYVSPVLSPHSWIL